MLEPSLERPFKDLWLEAIAISTVNFVLLFWPIYFAIDPKTVEQTPWLTWLFLILCLFAAPIGWAYLVRCGFRFLNAKGFAAGGSRTAWDEFFKNHAAKGCWVIVVLLDGTLLGGRMSKNSYATSFPREGHLYVQEAWKVDEDGTFLEELPGPQGLILRPADYKYIRVYSSHEGGAQL